METFWFFRLLFRRAYDSTYDSDFQFSLGHKRSYVSDYDSDSDSIASGSSLKGQLWTELCHRYFNSFFLNGWAYI